MRRFTYGIFCLLVAGSVGWVAAGPADVVVESTEPLVDSELVVEEDSPDPFFGEEDFGSVVGNCLPCIGPTLPCSIFSVGFPCGGGSPPRLCVCSLCQGSPFCAELLP